MRKMGRSAVGTDVRRVQLSDGRTLSYEERGAPDGKPVVCCHGSPGSRLDAHLIDPEIVARLGLRIITPDRPGLGYSTFQPRRSVLDWVKDVAAFADALALDRFALIGLSGGAPYAAACALRMPKRLAAVSIISGIAPLEAPGVMEDMGPSRRFFGTARQSFLLARLITGMMRFGMRDPDRYMAQAISQLSVPDQNVLQQARVRAAFLETMREALRPGTKGLAWDAAAIARPWGFQLHHIAIPVRVWHGEADINAPIAMGRYMAQTIPNCQARFYPNEGHLSLMVNHSEEILSTLAG